LRLWEIIVPNGVVVIVSTKGYGADELKSHIGKRLELTDSRELPYAEPTGEAAIATVTVWHRK
jgi:hypothetical protein